MCDQSLSYADNLFISSKHPTISQQTSSFPSLSRFTDSDLCRQGTKHKAAEMPGTGVLLAGGQVCWLGGAIRDSGRPRKSPVMTETAKAGGNSTRKLIHLPTRHCLNWESWNILQETGPCVWFRGKEGGGGSGCGGGISPCGVRGQLFPCPYPSCPPGQPWPRLSPLSVSTADMERS